MLLRISSAHAIHDVARATSCISSARTESKLNCSQKEYAMQKEAKVKGPRKRKGVGQEKNWNCAQKKSKIIQKYCFPIYRADDLYGNLISEYFCWMRGDPHFIFSRSIPFVIISIILKNKKKSHSNRVELIHGHRCARLGSCLF